LKLVSKTSRWVALGVKKRQNEKGKAGEVGGNTGAGERGGVGRSTIYVTGPMQGGAIIKKRREAHL